MGACRLARRGRRAYLEILHVHTVNKMKKGGGALGADGSDDSMIRHSPRSLLKIEKKTPRFCEAFADAVSTLQRGSHKSPRWIYHYCAGSTWPVYLRRILLLRSWRPCKFDVRFNHAYTTSNELAQPAAVTGTPLGHHPRGAMKWTI